MSVDVVYRPEHRKHSSEYREDYEMAYVYNLDLFVRTAEGLVNRPLYLRDGVGADPRRFSLLDSTSRLRLTGWWTAGHAVTLTPTGSAFSELREPRSRQDILFFLNDFLVAVEQVNPGTTGTGFFVNPPPQYRGIDSGFSWRVNARRAGERWGTML